MKKTIIKNELELITHLKAKYEILKQYDIINDYDIDYNQTNVSVGEDGKEEFDINIKITYSPKVVLTEINVDKIIG